MGRQAGATDPDQPRHAATTPDSEFSLSIEEVAELFAAAGIPRDLRTIQRYCRRGRLDARLVEFPYGEKYLVTPKSVEWRIAYLKELNLAAADRGEPGPAAATVVQETPEHVEERKATTSADLPRPVATNDDAVSRYVARLEDDNEFLRNQIKVKDEQIKDLAEHGRSTNNLIASIARRLPLLGAGPMAPHELHDEGGDNNPVP